jgi:hypothetical protein
MHLAGEHGSAMNWAIAKVDVGKIAPLGLIY